MISVQAFVTNNTYPKEFDEFMYNVENNYPFTIEMLVNNIYEEGYEWTAPKWCKEDDIVFFMFATRAKTNLSRVYTQYKMQYEDLYDNRTQAIVKNTFDRLRGIYKQYGGKIFAIARVSGSSFYDREYYDNQPIHWKSTIYAPISDLFLLERPVDISEFRDFLSISRVGTITPVMGNTFRQLKDLIARHNEIPSYFAESDATPTPLMSINDENWIEINNLYRHSYFLEHQFRDYYVDRFLSLLGDNKTFYSESVCVGDISDNSRVDNVIKFFGKYLPVEVKLNIHSEKDLPGQCRKYCRLKTIELKRPMDGNVCYTDHVLVIDTNALYLYSYETHTVDLLKSLDDIKEPSDVINFREELRGLLPAG